MKSLVGMFVWYNDDDFYRTGRIVEAVNDECFLIYMDWINAPDDVDLPLEVVSIAEMMASTNSNGHKKWMLFKTAQERNRFLKWLDSPSKPVSLVSIVKKPSS